MALGGSRPALRRSLDGVRIRIVQASVDQRDKWKPEKQGEIFRDQLDLSRHDASGRRDDLAGITHLIWPEAAMPFLPLEHPEALAAIGELLPDGTQLISGALRLKQSGAGALAARARATTASWSSADQGALEMRLRQDPSRSLRRVPALSERRSNGWGSSS